MGEQLRRGLRFRRAVIAKHLLPRHRHVRRTKAATTSSSTPSQQVTTGSEAEAYASFINGHLQGIADGATYAELGGPQSEARDALAAAQEAGEDDATIAELQGTVDELTGQRDSLFRGETLRGLLLSTFAWSTIGRIAGIAAIIAFIAAGAMVVLVVLGLFHRFRSTPSTT